MSSWVVLLVALMACLRLGGAQDPVPVSVVNLVMNSSSISSMTDLQELLDVHSVEEEEKEEDEDRSNGTHGRLPRSLDDVQMAQPAVCKVRTEVTEVTRSMLDRSNANFLLWPLCVEVQRCSGCCNTRTLQCVPVSTRTRLLQMTKIQFVNRNPVYEKVVLPVEDHLSCSCKSRAVADTARTRTATSPPPPPPPRLVTKPAVSGSRSKEELHRHDDLKRNQRFQLQDRETLWPSKYTQRTPVLVLAHTQSYRPGPFRHTGSEDASTKSASFGDTARLLASAKVREHLTHHGGGDGNVKSTASGERPDRHRHDGRPEAPVVGRSSGLLDRSSTPGPHLLETGQEMTEHRPRHHPRQHPTQSATQKAVTNAPADTPPAPHTPPPAVSQRKRRRKQRRRMSKSAMRAMIMVMS